MPPKRAQLLSHDTLKPTSSNSSGNSPSTRSPNTDVTYFSESERVNDPAEQDGAVAKEQSDEEKTSPIKKSSSFRASFDSTKKQFGLMSRGMLNKVSLPRSKSSDLSKTKKKSNCQESNDSDHPNLVSLTIDEKKKRRRFFMSKKKSSTNFLPLDDDAEEEKLSEATGVSDNLKSKFKLKFSLNLKKSSKENRFENVLALDDDNKMDNLEEEKDNENLITLADEQSDTQNDPDSSIKGSENTKKDSD